MAGRLAQDFVVDVLAQGLGVSHVVTGPGFVFGKGRRGNGYVLGHMAGMEGFGYTEIETFAHGAAKVSSTDIRVLLRRGQVDMAGDLLGHLWEFEGRVEPGDRRGRAMGFPTANLRLDGMLHPGPGIYAVRAGLAEPGTATFDGGTRWYDGAAYIGTRPTFDGKTVVLETNLFDFDGDLYGRRLRVAFVQRVRKDLTFAGMDDLARQMADDCSRAREVLAGLDGRSSAACGMVAGAA
jgi:riboflavin kinase / FMN adenylyltransferase